jgi:hypothetical protein
LYRGFVEEVRSDGLPGQVRLRIGDQTLTAVIKSTEVMIAREWQGPPESVALKKRKKPRRAK